MKIHPSHEEWIIVTTLAGVLLLQSFHVDSETVKYRSKRPMILVLHGKPGDFHGEAEWLDSWYGYIVERLLLNQEHDDVHKSTSRDYYAAHGINKLRKN